MSITRSGSAQKLTVAEKTVSGVGTGFSGLSVTRSTSPIEQVSAGVRTSHDSGLVVVGATFSVDLTETTRFLAFLTGTRVAVEWDDGTGTSREGSAIVSQLGWQLQPRAQARLDVTLVFDGDLA